MEQSHLQPGTLWPAILRQTEHALRCGALRPIDTTVTLLEEDGICFVVRQVSSLARKGKARRAHKVDARTGGSDDPFLPYERDLFVADLSDTHIALLNKFNVIDHHLLIVTRCFEPQESLLNPADFAALHACMAEFESLGFYNGGTDAGASQSHKHLQIVPLPLGESGPPLPVEPLFASARMEGSTGTIPGLPFRHAFAHLDPAPVDSQDAAHAAFECYRSLLDAVGLAAIDVNGELRQSAPYNLLVAPRWMLLVPRSAECVEGVSVNALGFAGSLFVRDEAQMQIIKRLGPMTVLRRAAVSTVTDQ